MIPLELNNSVLHAASKNKELVDILSRAIYSQSKEKAPMEITDEEIFMIFRNQSFGDADIGSIIEKANELVLETSSTYDNTKEQLIDILGSMYVLEQFIEIKGINSPGRIILLNNDLLLTSIQSEEPNIKNLSLKGLGELLFEGKVIDSVYHLAKVHSLDIHCYHNKMGQFVLIVSKEIEDKHSKYLAYTKIELVGSQRIKITWLGVPDCNYLKMEKQWNETGVGIYVDGSDFIKHTKDYLKAIINCYIEDTNI